MIADVPSQCTTIVLREHIKQDAVSKPGLEPTTRPQRAGLQNMAAEKLFAVIILKTNTPSTLRPRVSPRMPMARRTSKLSKQNGANALGIYLVLLRGFEPPTYEFSARSVYQVAPQEHYIWYP